MLKKYILFLVLLLINFNSYASHCIGGEILYAFNGVNYTVTFNFYRDCSGLIAPTNIAIHFSSSSTSQFFDRNLPRVNTSYLPDYCTSANTFCGSASPYPIREISTYQDTVTLSPCSDWVMSCNTTAPPPNLNNYQFFNSTLHFASFLNNQIAPNSNPFIANPPPFYIPINAFSTTSLQAVDPDNDSIRIYFIIPPDSNSILPNFAIGYSIDSLLGPGGIASIDSINHNLKLFSALTQNVYLATKTDEYRNNILVGYSIKCWLTTVETSGNAIEPLPAAGNTYEYVTHPGQFQALQFTMNDSNTTDSLFMSFNNLNNWPITATSSPGLGTVVGNLSWFTPPTLNPATTPFFFYSANANTNICPREASSKIGILVHVIPISPTDSVWPGDADDDYAVNMYDALAIAIAYGQTGATRTAATNTWVAQYCLPWVNSFPVTGANMKHADCNGDGIVDNLDLQDVITNYGLLHPKLPNRKASKITGVPDLFFDVSGVSLTPGANVIIPIKFGTSSVPVDTIYGLAASVEVLGGTALNASPTISYPSSWLGTTSNTLNFTKNVNNNRTDWAYARINHNDTNGNGTLATMSFSLPNTAVAGQKIILHFDQVRVVDKIGNILTNYNVLDDTLTITVGVQQVKAQLLDAIIVPNPSINKATLVMNASQSGQAQVNVINMLGELVWQGKANMLPGENSIDIPVKILPSSNYAVQIVCDGIVYEKVLRLTKY